MLLRGPWWTCWFCYTTREMKVIDTTIRIAELSVMAESMYGDFVKAVVDLQRHTLLVDLEMHADGAQYLLEHGSEQHNLWGIRLYPARFKTNGFIEFRSMINVRPRQQNMSREVEDPKIREQITRLVEQRIAS